MCGFLSNLGCCFPWAIPPDVFGIFEKKIFSCLDCLGIFFVFGKMEPYASKNFKTLLLQIAAETFQTSPEYSSQWSSQNTTFGIFKILKIEILMIFFSLLLTWDPIGVKISKTLLLLQIAAESFQTCPEFSSQWSSQNCVWEFEILSFLMCFFFCCCCFLLLLLLLFCCCCFFENFKFPIVPYGKTKNLSGVCVIYVSCLGHICATSGTLATFQVSCPNMAILKIGRYLGNRCP